MTNDNRRTRGLRQAAEGGAPEKKERKPSPARQILLDAAEGKETVLRFDAPEIAKGAAYGWWGARRRARLTEKVAINLDAKAMTVTIGPRRGDQTPKDLDAAESEVEAMQVDGDGAADSTEGEAPRDEAEAEAMPDEASDLNE